MKANYQDIVDSVLKEAAKLGCAKAEYAIAMMYSNGEGVTVDHYKAFEYFSSAANRGNDHAQFSLGDAYLYGVGVFENKSEANISVGIYRIVSRSK
jgi:TPR repeat protein